MFCGYVMLVGTTVLFFSSLEVQATGARVAPLFDSESFVQAAILWLGTPLLVCAPLQRDPRRERASA